MGIYIKGMKMPKDDEKMRFVKLLNGKMYAVKETRNGFPLSYLHEVIKVTEPHGRLVDIGKAMGLVASGVRLEIGELSELTTVIEAEGE